MRCNALNGVVVWGNPRAMRFYNQAKLRASANQDAADRRFASLLSRAGLETVEDADLLVEFDGRLSMIGEDLLLRRLTAGVNIIQRN